MLQIEIDNGSGFCFGVTTAIKKAEEELAKGGTLYCLGDIVHNSMEVERLHENGLVTINHDQLRELHDVKVLLRTPRNLCHRCKKQHRDYRCHVPRGVAVAKAHQATI